MSSEQMQIAANEELLEEYTTNCAVAGLLPGGNDFARLRQRTAVDIDTAEVSRVVGQIASNMPQISKKAKVREMADSIKETGLVDGRHTTRLNDRSRSFIQASRAESLSESSVVDRIDTFESSASVASAELREVSRKLDLVVSVLNEGKETGATIKAENDRRSDETHFFLDEIARLTEVSNAQGKQIAENQKTIASLTLSLTRVMEEFLNTKAYIADMANRATIPSLPPMVAPVALGDPPLELSSRRQAPVSTVASSSVPSATRSTTSSKRAPSMPSRK